MSLAQYGLTPRAVARLRVVEKQLIGQLGNRLLQQLLGPADNTLERVRARRGVPGRPILDRRSQAAGRFGQ